MAIASWHRSLPTSPCCRDSQRMQSGGAQQKCVRWCFTCADGQGWRAFRRAATAVHQGGWALAPFWPTLHDMIAPAAAWLVLFIVSCTLKLNRSRSAVWCRGMQAQAWVGQHAFSPLITPTRANHTDRLCTCLCVPQLGPLGLSLVLHPLVPSAHRWAHAAPILMLPVAWLARSVWRRAVQLHDDLYKEKYVVGDVACAEPALAGHVEGHHLNQVQCPCRCPHVHILTAAHAQCTPTALHEPLRSVYMHYMTCHKEPLRSPTAHKQHCLSPISHYRSVTPSRGGVCRCGGSWSTTPLRCAGWVPWPPPPQPLRLCWRHQRLLHPQPLALRHDGSDAHAAALVNQP